MNCRHPALVWYGFIRRLDPTGLLHWPVAGDNSSDWNRLAVNQKD